jgi:hypothetical protein
MHIRGAVSVRYSERSINACECGKRAISETKTYHWRSPWARKVWRRRLAALTPSEGDVCSQVHIISGIHVRTLKFNLRLNLLSFRSPPFIIDQPDFGDFVENLVLPVTNDLRAVTVRVDIPCKSRVPLEWTIGEQWIAISDNFAKILWLVSTARHWSRSDSTPHQLCWMCLIFWN